MTIINKIIECVTVISVKVQSFSSSRFAALVLAAAPLHCSAEPLMVVNDDPVALPVAGLTEEQQRRFTQGDQLFERMFREQDGLGPVYIRQSCVACHAGDGRGPGAVQRVAAVQMDRVTPLPNAERLLPWGTVVRPYFVAPATRGISAPTSTEDYIVSTRIGPSVMGRGWMEAIDERAIVAIAAEQARTHELGGGVHGTVPRLADGRLGRFGLKARVATLEAFAADAFVGDMGLTSPQRPTEVANPDGLVDDGRVGWDVSEEQVRVVGHYVSALAIPPRMEADPLGQQAFASVGCAQCHAPSMPTTHDYPIEAIRGRIAQVYTDMLLHDMGTGLADGIEEANASSRHWRTAPLIGMRLQRSYLHDGRAATLHEAIIAHDSEGSEAAQSVAQYRTLDHDTATALLNFVRGL